MNDTESKNSQSSKLRQFQDIYNKFLKVGEAEGDKQSGKILNEPQNLELGSYKFSVYSGVRQRRSLSPFIRDTPN